VRAHDCCGINAFGTNSESKKKKLHTQKIQKKNLTQNTKTPHKTAVVRWHGARQANNVASRRADPNNEQSQFSSNDVIIDKGLDEHMLILAGVLALAVCAAVVSLLVVLCSHKQPQQPAQQQQQPQQPQQPTVVVPPQPTVRHLDSLFFVFSFARKKNFILFFFFLLQGPQGRHRNKWRDTTAIFNHFDNLHFGSWLNGAHDRALDQSGVDPHTKEARLRQNNGTFDQQFDQQMQQPSADEYHAYYQQQQYGADPNQQQQQQQQHDAYGGQYYDQNYGTQQQAAASSGGNGWSQLSAAELAAMNRGR
jgi:hypothetical protein